MTNFCWCQSKIYFFRKTPCACFLF